MPATVRRELTPRPVRTLPAGAFPVPLSTLDWLLSRECPAARYVALRDLLNRPAKDIERRKARQVLVRDPFLKDALPQLRGMLPTGAPSDSSAAVDPGTSFVLLLLELGCDADVPELKHATDLLLARWQMVIVDIERGERPAVGSGFVSACRALFLLGLGDDPRLLSAADHLARRRVTSDHAGESVAADLLVLTSIAEEKRSAAVQNAISFCIERARSVELPAMSEDSAKTGIGVGDPSDLPRAPPRPRRRGSLPLARGRRRPDASSPAPTIAPGGSWRPVGVALPVPLEREGDLSRWVTLRALGVLQHFLSLTITGAP
ncbi:MAG: hypothetical protein IPP07_08240 [Holophagales bacterium]|nr:hypothetical protein [Holophagales bacterium]